MPFLFFIFHYNMLFINFTDIKAKIYIRFMSIKCINYRRKVHFENTNCVNYSLKELKMRPRFWYSTWCIWPIKNRERNDYTLENAFLKLEIKLRIRNDDKWILPDREVSKWVAINYTPYKMSEHSLIYA